MSTDKLNDEIQKRKKTNPIRKNLIAVKVAMEQEEKTFFLPEKDLAIMEETSMILYNAGIFCQLELIEDAIPVGKILFSYSRSSL